MEYTDIVVESKGPIGFLTLNSPQTVNLPRRIEQALNQGRLATTPMAHQHHISDLFR